MSDNNSIKAAERQVNVKSGKFSIGGKIANVVKKGALFGAVVMTTVGGMVGAQAKESSARTHYAAPGVHTQYNPQSPKNQAIDFSRNFQKGQHEVAKQRIRANEIKRTNMHSPKGVTTSQQKSAQKHKNAASQTGKSTNQGIKSFKSKSSSRSASSSPNKAIGAARGASTGKSGAAKGAIGGKSGGSSKGR